MDEYIWPRQNTAAQYIDTRSLPDLCEGTERPPREHVCMRWWDQADINLEGARVLAVVGVEEEEDGVEELRRGQK